MDDLSGLDWTNTSATQKPSGPAYPSLRPSPAPSSGRSTPSAFRPPPPTIAGAATSKPTLRIASKPATPANDSFANLLSGGGNSKKAASSSLSLQERQRQLTEERAKKSLQFDSHFGQLQNASSSGSRSTSGLSGVSGVSTLPSRVTPSPSLTQQQQQQQQPPKRDHDDILAAFNSSAKVDSSSHFPPIQQQPLSRTDTPSSWAEGHGRDNVTNVEDDDPFDLSSFTTKPQKVSTPIPHDDDGDILGMLARPVHEVTAPKITRQTIPDDDNDVEDNHSIPTSVEDEAVAELVDMGFTADRAAIALAQTDSGHDVRAAVGILLNQAHEEARNKSQGSSASRDPSRGERSGKPTGSKPSWSRQTDDESRSSSQSRSQAGAEKDVAKIASDLGNTLFKSANSLWKTSQKKVQKAMADFQQEGGDASQPKWMREVQTTNTNGSSSASTSAKREVTDEAAMLESGNSRPVAQPKLASRSSASSGNGDVKGNGLVNTSQRSAHQSFDNPNGNRSSARVTSRPFREDLERDAPAAYISPARRRKPQAATSEVPSITHAPKSSPLASPPVQSNNPFQKVAQKSSAQSSRPPASVRPKAPPRRIPPVSSSALSSASQQRQRGTEAFKRGDFASAHAAYSSALQPLPQSHPVTIVIFCNRALTSLKNGDPKAAISDADSALEVIGISNGEGEKIDLGHNEGTKDMKEFFGKALMRKAEALENMEKWADAGKIWQDAVEAGVGGSISIQGRNRCEKASGGGATTSAPKKPMPRPKPAARRPVTNHVASQEAVKKLRQANEAAERADDEKFALTDQVDAKLVAWKGTKADNLRALLGSMDKVLWPEAGWNKVGMADLVMANRVKIIYMKAIAKVHPDKIPQNATTEQRMLSAAIFSTLNEAWDKFKQENNL